MASTTVSGIGSGVDTQSIVKALADAEKAPKQQQITTQQKTTTTQVSAVGMIKNALDTFRSAIAKLNTSTSFTGLAGTSSDEKVAKATVTASASAGNYALEVTQLATSSKITTDVFAGGVSSVVNNSGDPQTLTISQSSADYNVTIPDGATLQQVRDLINKQLGSQGINANILTDAKGSRLVMSSSTTGEGSDITLSGDSSLVQNATPGAPAQNAKYTIDGLELESKSNTVTGAISGVNFELLAEGKSRLSVATNTTTLKTSVQSFVSAYNALITAINTQTKVTATGDASTTTAGALTGDATMRALVSTVRNELVKSTGAGSISMLSQMGINTDQQTGLLVLDDTKWDKAVAKGAADIAAVFTGDKGLIKRMTAATDAYTGTTGILATRTKNLNDNLTELTKQQEALDRRIETLTATLTAKYNAMDTLVAKLNATSSSVMTTLNAMNKANNDD
ncbi:MULTISPECIES: flagellar filament capping protein FliD [Pseudomonas]|uniref:Flagellar hook-associated protein 2 n=1 Tax=Pseudomonas putida (strain ATCC 47054 / DSM 6125 / CFBP 8728 / NCIMB 11950 / KT2440) TaxID=160488 RepID=Q88ES7_PSEPK|nr:MULTISPECIES: flagellar filament capping protein FliD [Pseudomonas]AAN69954.1 flagellar filament capping protein [Pseudomonas putida KT2440]KMU96747.1 flagellar cap protein FliD [Pseudomonas putida]KMY30021.1 flagellar cap protein FliD [Pseudomonas putida]MBP2841361.1 flagellar filament capping protein FliD [Pseudomonas sp. PNP]MCE0893194.1 flagellar filament capping protein FliD [Pseudomonas alloputida]